MLAELDALDDNAVVRRNTWGLDLAGLGGAPTSITGAAGIGGLLAVRDESADEGGGPVQRDLVYFVPRRERTRRRRAQHLAHVAVPVELGAPYVHGRHTQSPTRFGRPPSAMMNAEFQRSFQGLNNAALRSDANDTTAIGSDIFHSLLDAEKFICTLSSGEGSLYDTFEADCEGAVKLS